MTDVDAVIDEFLLIHGGDKQAIAAYNKAYYLRNRQLQGRQLGTPKRVEEDEVPMTSPSGSKLVDYDGKGPGKAIYADGSVFDGNGWGKAKANVNSVRSATKRINQAQAKINRAKFLANKVADRKARRVLLDKLMATQRKLNAAKKADSGSTRGPDKAGRPAGHPNYGDDPPVKRKGVA